MASQMSLSEAEAYINLRVRVLMKTDIGRTVSLSPEERRNMSRRIMTTPGEIVTITRVEAALARVQPYPPDPPGTFRFIVRFRDGYGWLFPHELDLSPLAILAASAEEQ